MRNFLENLLCYLGMLRDKRRRFNRVFQKAETNPVAQLEGKSGGQDPCPLEKYALNSVNHSKITECFTSQAVPYQT